MEFIALTDALGVDATKPVELCHYPIQESPGQYVTSGWFHLVGSIISGADAQVWEGNTGRFQLEQLVPGLEFGFSARLVMVPKVFDGLPVIQLEFVTRVPWVLDEPAPELIPSPR
jgi:hypothetical protein